MEVSVPGFVRLAEILTILADKLCDGRLVFTLEGGYDYQALSSSVVSTLNRLLGIPEIYDPLGKRPEKALSKNFDDLINLIKDTHKIRL